MEWKIPRLASSILCLALLPVFAVAADHLHDKAQSADSPKTFDQYAAQASELSFRARANVYFPNPQSVFKGVQVSFVNVGTGDITFLRRDIVAPGRIPLVLARVYDSSNGAISDFGQGWRISAAETISVADHKAHFLTGSGAIIDFIEKGDGNFRLEKDFPSDYSELIMRGPDTIIASLRTGLQKQFKLIGGTFRLVEVADRNGNTVQLTYTKGLLSRIENANHFLQLTRDDTGRVAAVEDDQSRIVHYKYDGKGRLAEVDDLGGRAWRYAYTDGDKLEVASDPLRRKNFIVFYGDTGRVKRLQLPSGVIRFDYDDQSHATTVIDRKDMASTFFQNDDGITVRILNNLGEETKIGLDDSRNPITLSRNGAIIVRMKYDDQHRVIAQSAFTDTTTVERKYTYDPSTGLLSGIHPSTGKDLSFSYDGKGNVKSATLDDGTIHKYGYSDEGDLTSFSSGKIDLALTTDGDGLIASLTDQPNTPSTMEHNGAGELSQATFAGGRSVQYFYQPSGLRSKLVYNDGWAVKYSYDPAGNLTSTKVLDPKGKQIGGQVLTLDESYRLTKQTTFSGQITDFEYDKNGNLTAIKSEHSSIRFEYDPLNRLMAIVTPDHQRLTYSYKAGEQSVLEAYDHSAPMLGDQWDSGLTFGSEAEVFSTRPLVGSLGPVRFSELLGTFQLQNAEGNEILTPDSAIEQALHKEQLIAGGTPLQQRQNQFNRPFNTLFIPAEYASINCCPLCITNPSRCFNCDPAPPPDPPFIASIDPAEGQFGTTVQVTISGNFFGSDPQINTPTGITATRQGVTSSTIVASFAIASTATIGNYNISVTDPVYAQTSNAVTFTVTGPHHMIVESDITGLCSGCLTTVLRSVTYQVVDQDGLGVGQIGIGESAVLGANSCNNGGTHLSLCGSASTDAQGQFTDDWSINTDNVPSASCGFTITDEWEWCRGTTTSNIGNLSGYIHADHISINGSISPSQMPQGTVINP